MRILVASDTHHDKNSLYQAILSQPTAQVVIHLGDGADEAEEMRYAFPDRMFLQVRGNCDWGSSLPVVGEITLEGKKIMYTHGHAYQVKYGTYDLISAARDRKADIVLYGHTHQAETRYEDGLYIMNPGSLAGNGSYGIVDLTKAGIVTNIVVSR